MMPGHRAARAILFSGIASALVACSADTVTGSAATVSPTTLTLGIFNSIRIEFEEPVLEDGIDEVEDVTVRIGESPAITWPGGGISRVTAVDSRRLLVEVTPPQTLGAGAYPLEVRVKAMEFRSELTRQFLLKPSPDGTGFCCPASRGDCNKFSSGGWLPADDPSRCQITADAAPPLEFTTDEHGCEVILAKGSCLGP